MIDYGGRLGHLQVLLQPAQPAVQVRAVPVAVVEAMSVPDQGRLYLVVVGVRSVTHPCGNIMYRVFQPLFKDREGIWSY